MRGRRHGVNGRRSRQQLVRVGCDENLAGEWQIHEKMCIRDRPTEKPPADPTETLMTEPADGDEDSSYEADEMTEPVSEEGVLLAAELATSGSCGATESDNVSWALTVNKGIRLPKGC